MQTNKNSYILILVLVLIGGAIYYLESGKPNRALGVQAVSVATSSVHTPDFASRSAMYPMATELVSPDGYINASSTFTLSSLIGKKIVLLDFWTYSCINCQRTIPYLNAWYQKYKDFGLEIVGVHTPEFDFEKILSNVQMGVAKFGIKYPVVLDSEYATWQAYGNNYWPEHYLIDINGLVVDRQIGEGGYADTEAKIQQLLKERSDALGLNLKIPTGTVDITQAINASSPETYFGAARNDYLGNGTKGATGVQTLSMPAAQLGNTLYLTGSWNFVPEYAETTGTDAHIIYKYDAQNVYFVASAPQGAAISVLRDGVPVSAERGDDVDASGNAQIKEARLYTLIKEKAMGEHTLEIIVHNAGLQAFTFTFG